VTDLQSTFRLDVRKVHVTPSGEVMTEFVETATKRSFPKVTELQLLSAADIRFVQLIPSGEVMTRFPVPVLDTATKILFP